MKFLLWSGKTLKRVAVTVLLLGLLVLASGLLVMDLAMRKASANPQTTAAWLSQQANVPLQLDTVKTRWTREGPVMTVGNLRVGEGADAMQLGDAQLILSLYEGWLPRRAFSKLRLTGLHLNVSRSESGAWSVHGLPQSGNSTSDPLTQLSRLGELQIVNASVAIDAPGIGLVTRFPRANLRLRSDSGRFEGGMRAWSELSREPIDAAMVYQRKKQEGQFWIGAAKVNLADWSSLLEFRDVKLERGRGRLDAWLSLKDRRVSAVVAQLNLGDVTVRDESEQASFSRIDGLAKLENRATHWRLDVPSLRVERGATRAKVDKAVLAWGNAAVFQAAEVQGGLISDVARFVPWIAADIRAYLRDAKPTIDARKITYVRDARNQLRVEGDLRSLDVLPALGKPGVRGIEAYIRADNGGWTARFGGSKAVTFTYPGVFAESFSLVPKGVVSVTERPGQLVFKTRDLQLSVDGHPFVINGHAIKTQLDSLPTLNLTAAAERFPVNRAKKFWVRNKMPATAIQWLDDAFLAGELRDVRASFVGNPAAWPLGPGRGFLATAQLAGGRIHFTEGWPAAENLNAQMRFENDGFDVKGTATLDEVPVGDIRVGIDHYAGGTLTIRAGTSTDGARGIALLRKSPIAAHEPETFSNLKVQGPVRSGFALDMPLTSHSTPVIRGIVDFADAKIEDPRYKIALSKVRGRGVYDTKGFLASNLRVVREGTAGSLDVRVGAGHVRDATNLVEVAMDSSISTAVIDRYTTSLNWLKPFMQGSANWSVQVNVPAQSASKGAAMLVLDSDLVGVNLLLPEPMRKPARQALPTRVEIPLPVDDGEISLRFGQRAAMKVLQRNGESWVRVNLGSSMVASPTQAGLTVQGSADKISALDWIAVAKSDVPAAAGANASSGKPLRLNRMDVQAQHLYVLGGDFRNTRVQLQPLVNGDLQITATGPQIRGDVFAPSNPRAAIRGRFGLVEFRDDGLTDQQANVTLSRNVGGSKVAEDVRNTAQVLSNPANIQPLDFKVEHLKVGSVVMGSAQFASIPTAAGLKVTRMSVQNAAYTVTGTGLWTLRNAVSRTSLDATVQTNDAGAAVAVFGAPGQLVGGKGAIVLDVGWSGSPADFAVAKLEGKMSVDLREGRIPELKPGVGRVLGLLSIAELPRRLTLDFRDFFDKGLRFNSVKGEVNLRDGLAVTRNLSIDAAAAKIFINGQSDLRRERFDQIVTVEPRAGGVLTAIGAVAGGPIGAAVGAAANAILQKPIGQMAAKRYHVTGEWKNPQVQVIQRSGH